MTSATPSWVSPVVLNCPGIVRAIRLEPLEHRHAADLFAVATPDLFAHTMQSPAEWSLSGFERDVEYVRSLPGVVAFAIVLAEASNGVGGGRAVGRTTFMDVRPEHRGLEIGRTWIGRPFQGTRVNPEAKYLMLRHAFEQLAPTAIRVQITTNIDNRHSQAAIEKLGATREGVLRKSRVLLPSLGRPASLVRDWVYYGITDDEWPAVRGRLEGRLAS